MNFNYICNYISKNYKGVVELEENLYIKLLAKRIIESMPNVNFTTMQYNFYIDDYINKLGILKNSKSFKELMSVKDYVLLKMNLYKEFINVDNHEFENLKQKITLMLFTTYYTNDILFGRCDEIIREELGMLKRADSDKEQKVRNSVTNYVKRNGTYIDENESIDETIKISKELIDKGFSFNQVDFGACDQIIDSRITRDSIKKNSVESSNEEYNSIPLRIKTRISLRTKAITLAVTVAILSGVFLKNYKENIQESAVEISENIDDYAYPRIPNEDSNEFVDTSFHVIYKFNDYINCGEEYGQLCLYRCFKSIDSEQFHAMDVVMRLAHEFAKNNENLSKIDSDLNQYSYVSYVYNKLDEAGIDSAKTKNIEKAITNYNRQVSNYKQLNPFSLLEKSDQNALKELMRIYNNYCEKLTIKMADMLDENTKGAK